MNGRTKFKDRILCFFDNRWLFAAEGEEKEDSVYGGRKHIKYTSQLEKVKKERKKEKEALANCVDDRMEDKTSHASLP